MSNSMGISSASGAAAVSTAQLVVLIGHCGPDSSYLRISVQKALPGALVRSAHSDSELSNLLAAVPGEAPQPLLLINRVLEPGFETESGVELIEAIHRKRPLAKLMLVSNYADAQEAARKAGALSGFGKREIGSSALAEKLQAAVK